MSVLPEIVASIPGIPLTHLVALLGIGALVLAAFTVHAIVTVVKGRDNQ